MSNVKKKVAEEVPGSDLEATEDLGNVELFPECQFGSADNLYRRLCGHQDALSRKTSTTAVNTTLSTAIGNSPFQPKVMSWS